MVVLATAAFAQKVMKLPAELQPVKPMTAVPKGISTIPKYQFGPYKIASGKAGWIKSKSKGKGGFFFNDYEKESISKQKISFVFVGKQEDTVRVNAAIHSQFKTRESFGITSLQTSKNNFIAELTTDTLVWNLAITIEEGLEVKDNYQVSGFATNGVNTILFKPVTRWVDGSKSMTDVVIGYALYMDDKPIGAVQASINTFHKKYVWLQPDLSPQLKISAAAMAACIFVMGDMKEGGGWDADD
jgi:hypothetical protein